MGTQTPEKDDRRVQRTRRALRAALIALTVERGYEGFSVQDVCDRADVGRSTFYTHFADKDDLVEGAIQDLRDLLRAQVVASSPAPSRPLAFSRGLIEHAHEERRLFRALVGQRSGHLVQTQFRQMVAELVREDLSSRLAAGIRRDALVVFLSGALFEILGWSVEARPTPSPEVVDELFHDLAAPVLGALGVVQERPRGR